MQHTNQSNLGLLVLYTLPQHSLWETLHGRRWKVLSFLSDEEEALILDTSVTHGVELVEVTKEAWNR